MSQDVIRLSSPATAEFWKIPVCYEDEHLLALDKPARLLTSPDRFDPNRPNLMKLLHTGIAQGAGWAVRRGLKYLANAHRLDDETTGILLLAKNKPALISLANQFGIVNQSKTFLALVQGSPAEDAFGVEAALGPDPFRAGYVRVDPKHGKKAITQFQVRERFRGFTWIECHPATARPHQIRVHLRHLNLPLAGDLLYGGQPLLLSRLKPHYRLKPNKPEHPLIGRVALHAIELAVTHPANGSPVTLRVPLPRDLDVALKYLRIFAAVPPSGPSGLSSAVSQ